MEKAISLSLESAQEGEVPVGAVVAKDGEIVSIGRNRSEKNSSALHHAEIEAIEKACRKLKRKYLSDCEIYVTLEPCPMCTGAIIHARVGTLIFGSYNEKEGACCTVTNLFELFHEGRNTGVIGGYMGEECAEVLRRFFIRLRDENGKK